MTYDAISTKIDAFWKWFAEQEDTIKDFFSDEAEVDKDKLIEEMNNLVLDLGRFAWEIGPDREGAFYLILSPNRDPELLELSKRIMAASPDLPDWELHPAKPARTWDWKLRLYDDFFLEREVDASGWQFVLLDRPGNQVEILFEADNLAYFDTETQQMAGETAVTNLLGEEMRIRYVRKVGVSPELREEHQEQRRPIQLLKEAFEEWVG
jgi:hypothetical protein